MSARDDGGAAFPTVMENYAGGNFSGLGLSVRDYFMAHAPTEPHAWFQPALQPRPRKPAPPPDDLTPEERDELSGLDEFMSLEEIESPRIREYGAQLEAYRHAEHEWELAYSKARCTQWPAAWADEMLKERAR